MIIRMNVVLYRTLLLDGDLRFDNLCSIVIFRVNMSCITSVNNVIKGMNR